ncbi:NADH-quinone oxidoreductase subunit E [Rhodobium orientis]|uniref:NADH-quinone oxidoreductase subunit E n=1 Tax=Rhodobium orientis TaxID=34017 RepID=A0A327JQC8_9HYPH|nr:NADH-quinone oxidoreductase subunit NuoE [Rhodobium orientis]MBB4302417.1 NADH-quinone oxidoreductase subunit E [Rhodobium orientis]MBK5949268.1 NADH-quinone oxidoreductase subunit E [Rhodobium orientis]RAI28679.1 NADH-quinone oxidoreductase subunit E [Rhodobium orientis]
MSVRRLYNDQPESFAFTPENEAWAEKRVALYPEDRKQSAVIPLLMRAQEQDGWLTRAAIEAIARRLEMPVIRVLEVATFYTQFQLAPVGSKAHIQVCGTTPCMLRGSEDILRVCRTRIAERAHELSADGAFSWEEVECLGACVNAPMVQVGADTYEDLTVESFEAVLDAFDRGETPTPGPQVDRQFAAPEGGATTLTEPALYDGSAPARWEETRAKKAAEAEKAKASEEAKKADKEKPAPPAPPAAEGKGSTGKTAAEGKGTAGKTAAEGKGPDGKTEDGKTADMEAALAKLPADASNEDKANAVGTRPEGLDAPRGEADDLKRIRGIGKVNEGKLNDLGIFHFDQIAAWDEAQIRWVGTYLAFPGRIEREDWVGQAGTLAEGGATEFSKRVDAGDVPSSQE